RYGRIVEKDLHEVLYPSSHGLERNSHRRLSDSNNGARVLLGKKSLWHLKVENSGGEDGRSHHGESGAAMAEDDDEGGFIAGEQFLENGLQRGFLRPLGGMTEIGAHDRDQC